MNFSNKNFEDVDVKYLVIMHLEKMSSLTELSLNLSNNSIKNEGFVKLILGVIKLSNLISLNLEL